MANDKYEGFIRIARKVLAPIASLKIAVTLFALSIVLVFFGTLAQTTVGIWTVVDQYFYSWFVSIELRHFNEFLTAFNFDAMRDLEDAKLPFPAGKLIGWTMLVNLLAAHTLQLINLVQGVKKQAGRSNTTSLDVLKVLAKRTGIYIIHAGILLLLVGEAITREQSVEQFMSIDEGGSASVAVDTRNHELAFVNASASATTDTVTVVPHTLLKPNAKLSDAQLPVDIVVKEYLSNSTLVDITKGQKNPATAGYGLNNVAIAKKPTPGIDTSKERDLPALYAEFFEKGTTNSLGVYLFSPELKPYTLKLSDGTTVNVKLRNTEHAKPYRLELIEFKFDKFMGTTKAKNYSSKVRLIDDEQGINRELTIRMNEPLRHRGETYFQADFDKKTEKTTYLQVVRNPAWTLPYIAVVLLSVGMLVHFGIVLVTFLNRLAKAPVMQTTSANAVPMPMLTKKSLWPIVIGLGLTTMIFGALSMPKPQRNGELDLGELARVPVIDGGRLKPLDTVARVALRVITETEDVWVPDANYQEGGKNALNELFAPQTKGKKKISAIQWFLDVASSDPKDPDDVAMNYDVFRIHNEEVYSTLGLKRREGYRFSIAEVAPKFEKLEEQAKKAVATDSKKRSVAQRKTLELADHAKRYVEVSTGQQPLLVPPTGDGTEWISLSAAIKASRERGVDQTTEKLLRERIAEAGLGDLLKAREFVSGLGQKEQVVLRLRVEQRELNAEQTAELNRIIGPEIVAQTNAMFTALPERLQKFVTEMLLDTTDAPEFVKAAQIAAELSAQTLKQNNPGAAAWKRVLATYRAGKAEEFNAAVTEYRGLVEAKLTPVQLRLCHFEQWLNHTAMYYACTVAYAVAMVLGLTGFICLLPSPKTARFIRHTTYWLIVGTFLVHTFTLFARMAIMERPLVFVTNLYSSAVFIGWGIVGVCLFLERVYAIGIGNLAGGVLGFATCIIAHNIALEKDTIEQMEAVLDTNYWLASHVTTVTLGYSATYLAGLLGMVYVVLYAVQNGVLGRKVQVRDTFGAKEHELGKMLGSLMYGVTAFALLLSTVGTVLGGIWADQSWGRFWGWDPKENGAILIVIWNAIILHARWGGLIKERGMAVLAIVGNMVTTWSWFGTNQLSVGLHAYGFSDQLSLTCKVVWAVCAVWIAVGVLPWHWIWTGKGYTEAATSRPA
jgi:ABC-type transport system involved in cytochrome c biogenesis permease subunit